MLVAVRLKVRWFVMPKIVFAPLKKPSVVLKKMRVALRNVKNPLAVRQRKKHA